MELELRCNIVKCRSKVRGSAYITSCSHIFCLDCASKTFNRSMTCPACHSQLVESRDLFYADLKPTEEWKSMVISAQKPETIAEICSRALSFWSYQMYQEQSYQEILLQSVQEKKSHQESALQVSLQQSKGELLMLKEKLTETVVLLDGERKRFADVSEQLNDRNRQLKKMQTLCDGLRRKVAFAPTLNAHNIEGPHIEAQQLASLPHSPGDKENLPDLSERPQKHSGNVQQTRSRYFNKR